MAPSVPLTESMENYLEAIFNLEITQKVARVKDIAKKLSLQRGSVSGALKSLEEKGLINYEPYSFITLTAAGKKIAQEIAHRHEVLKDFLLNVLQIEPLIAESTACRMEHVIDKTTLDRLVCFIEYIHKCPRAGDDWLAAFVRYCKANKQIERPCRTCIAQLTKIIPTKLPSS